MKALNSKLKGQVSLEYLIIIGIGLLILSTFLAYTFYYSSAYSATENGQNLALIVNSISGAVSYLSSQQTGSSMAFTFDSPGLNILNSYLCNSYLILASSGAEDTSTLSLPIVGELPINPGQFSGQAKLVEIDGKQTTLLSFDLPVSFINASYAFNSSNTKILSYNLSFLSQSGAAVDDINFNITVYTIGDVQIASENESATSGAFYGAINLTKTYPEVKIIVSVPSLGVASSECFIPSQQLKITLLNPEFAATPSPFQQVITINSSAYSKYEASNLQDIQFSYSNGTVIPSWLESGNLADFNGYTSRIVPPQTVNYSFSKATITGWVEISGFTSSNGVQEWWTNNTASPSFGLQSYPNTYPDPTSTSFTFFVLNSTRGTSSCNSTSIPLNTVYFVAEVIDENNAIMYVDGKPSCTFTFDGAGIGNVSLPVIGSYSPGDVGAGSVMDGVIANVQAYDTSLTSSQVASLYKEGEAGSPITIAKGWWPLAGNANDHSGNGYNGVVYNVSFSGAGSASTDTTYWLKLGAGIPANSELSIYMDLYSPPYNLFNTQNTGEAPQLSPTYGEYDDGANVFTYYDNFAGSLVSNGYTEVIPSGTTITQDNGITITTDSSAAYGGLVYDNGFTPPVISEADVITVSGVAAGIAQQIGDTPTSAGYDFNYWSGSVAYGSMQNGTTGAQNPALTITNGIIGQVWISGSAQAYYIDYSAPHQGTLSAFSFPTLVYPSMGIYADSPNSNIEIQWFRVRAYPPNGVMPLVAIGSLT